MPLVEAIAKHVFVGERIHADDTTVPVLAKGKTHTGRLWVYMRDDAPFGDRAPPAAVYYDSPDRGGGYREHHLAGYSGLLQDSYAGFNGLYVAGRKPGPITEAACWAHGRRKFYELAELRKAPLAIEALRRIDELFAIERRSMVSLRISVSPSAASDRSRAATRSKPGCGRSAASSPPATR